VQSARAHPNRDVDGPVAWRDAAWRCRRGV